MLIRCLIPFHGPQEAFPGAGDGGSRDRYAALALLFHPVGDGGALVHFAHLVDGARVKEDALRGRRLARVDVRRDPDVCGSTPAGNGRFGEFTGESFALSLTTVMEGASTADMG